MIKTLNQVFLTRLQGALEYAGFVQLVEVSVYLHRKGRVNKFSVQDAQCMMMSQMVSNTLLQVKEIMKKRGETIEIFTGNEKITKV